MFRVKFEKQSYLLDVDSKKIFNQNGQELSIGIIESLGFTKDQFFTLLLKKHKSTPNNEALKNQLVQLIFENLAVGEDLLSMKQAQQLASNISYLKSGSVSSKLELLIKIKEKNKLSFHYQEIKLENYQKKKIDRVIKESSFLKRPYVEFKEPLLKILPLLRSTFFHIITKNN